MSLRRVIAVVLSLCACGSACRPEIEAAPAPAVAEVQRSGRRLHLDAEAQTRLDLADAVLERAEHAASIVVFGQVHADPAASFALRAPAAGIWRAPSFTPELGLRVTSDTACGWIEARLTPAESADARARLAAARADLASASAASEASRRELERARALHADDRAVSDRALEAAIASAASDAARVDGARATIAALESWLHRGDDALSAVPLRVERAGVVVEFGAHPGESVDAGALLMRCVDPSRPLVRLELPFGVDLRQLGKTARVASAYGGGSECAATFVADVNDSGSTAPRRARWFRIDDPAAGGALVPGESVRATLQIGDGLQSGVLVPRAAVVRLAGRCWVWLRADTDEFERVEIALDRPHGETWFTDAAWARDARVVVRGAQALLSAELLAAEGRPETEE